MVWNVAEGAWISRCSDGALGNRDFVGWMKVDSQRVSIESKVAWLRLERILAKCYSALDLEFDGIRMKVPYDRHERWRRTESSSCRPPCRATQAPRGDGGSRNTIDIISLDSPFLCTLWTCLLCAKGLPLKEFYRVYLLHSAAVKSDQESISSRSDGTL